MNMNAVNEMRWDRIKYRVPGSLINPAEYGRERMYVNNNEKLMFEKC